MVGTNCDLHAVNVTTAAFRDTGCLAGMNRDKPCARKSYVYLVVTMTIHRVNTSGIQIIETVTLAPCFCSITYASKHWLQSCNCKIGCGLGGESYGCPMITHWYT